MTESSMEASVSQPDTLSGLLPIYLRACDECMQGPLPHIQLTLLTQYKMWWSALPHCRGPTTQHSHVVIYSHNHEKVSVPLKSQVFGGHTTHWARSIMSLFYMAHFEATAASYAISEALIYWGANSLSGSKAMGVHRYQLTRCTCMHTYSSTHTCILSRSACVYSVSTCTHIIQQS